MDGVSEWVARGEGGLVWTFGKSGNVHIQWRHLAFDGYRLRSPQRRERTSYQWKIKGGGGGWGGVEFVNWVVLPPNLSGSTDVPTFIQSMTGPTCRPPLFGFAVFGPTGRGLQSKAQQAWYDCRDTWSNLVFQLTGSTSFFKKEKKNVSRMGIVGWYDCRTTTWRRCDGQFFIFFIFYHYYCYCYYCF